MTKLAAANVTVLVLALALAVACGPSNPGGYEPILAPSFQSFAGMGTDPGVHTFLERRCGTLDCHGQLGRPFRLFSTVGLRLINDAGLVSGGGPDTAQEIFANYEALVGLQPVDTSLVTEGRESPRSLLVVAKPLALQVHKGGAVLAPGDSGDVCLESWLTGTYDAAHCADAAKVP